MVCARPYNWCPLPPSREPERSEMGGRGTEQEVKGEHCQGEGGGSKGGGKGEGHGSLGPFFYFIYYFFYSYVLPGTWCSA